MDSSESRDSCAENSWWSGGSVLVFFSGGAAVAGEPIRKAELISENNSSSRSVEARHERIYQIE